MANKNIGLGYAVACKFDDASFTTVINTTSITQPNRERVEVDGTVLADTLATNELGIENHSHFTFEHFWDANDAANHELMDTNFGDEKEHSWKITDSQASPVTDTFNGKIVAMVPEAIEHDTINKRTITVHRTGDITRA